MKEPKLNKTYSFNNKMEINNKTYKKLLLYAGTIVDNEDDAKDLLQEFLLLTLEKEMDFNYVYALTTMKNMFLQKLQKENRNFRKIFPEEYIHLNQNESVTTEEEMKELQDKDKEFQSKIDSIGQVYNQLNTFDKQLYYLHYVKGLSQRHISRETKIHYQTIYYRFILIKEKITQYHKNKENEKTTK